MKTAKFKTKIDKYNDLYIMKHTSLNDAIKHYESKGYRLDGGGLRSDGTSIVFMIGQDGYGIALQYADNQKDVNITIPSN